MFCHSIQCCSNFPEVKQSKRLSDICVKRHLSKRHLHEIGLREKERCGQMALLATYPDFGQAYCLSPSSNLLPFPLA